MRNHRPNKKKNVISLYRWKLNEFENFNKDPKKSIRGTDSEFKTNIVYKEIQNYFDLKGDGKDMRRIFESYRGETKEIKALKATDKEAYNRILNEKRKEYHNIPAENIAAEVDAKIGAYQKKYNILAVLNDNRSGKEVDPEVQFESQKIIRDLWEMGFSYEKVIELLGLEDDFANYRSTVENQTGSSSSSSTAQTRLIQPLNQLVPQNGIKGNKLITTDPLCRNKKPIGIRLAFSVSF